jgi:hypothetical protein
VHLLFDIVNANFMLLIPSMSNMKFANAQQTKAAYNYKTTKEKLYKTSVALWFNNSHEFCFIIYWIFLSAFVGLCCEYKNMLGMSNVNLIKHIFSTCISTCRSNVNS